MHSAPITGHLLQQTLHAQQQKKEGPTSSPAGQSFFRDPQGSGTASPSHRRIAAGPAQTHQQAQVHSRLRLDPTAAARLKREAKLTVVCQAQMDMPAQPLAVQSAANLAEQDAQSPVQNASQAITTVSNTSEGVDDMAM